MVLARFLREAVAISAARAPANEYGARHGAGDHSGTLIRRCGST